MREKIVLCFRVAVVGTLFVLAGTTGRAYGQQSEKLNGFLSPVINRRSVPAAETGGGKRLSLTKTSRDTLDPVLMAKWSLNYLVGSVSEEADFASSYGNWPLKMPPFAQGGDKIAIGDSEVRNALAFVLMRDMSGIDFGANVQKGVMARVLRYQQPCGLFNPPRHGDTDILWATAWATRALIETFATTGNREALFRAKRALQAVRRYAVESDGKGLLRLAPPEKLLLDGQEVHFAYRPSLDFCIVEPFVRYYEVTGDSAMLDIARGLVDGRIRGYATGHDTGHTHSHWHSLIGIAHLGAVTEEKKYLDWVENQLERWNPLMTDYGWFEAIGNYGASETCAVSDLMHISTYLGRAGRSLRYDLVERTLRNYLPQEQFFVDDPTFLQLWRKQNYADRDKQMALMRRLEGGFLCRTTPSDRWALPGSPEGPISLEGCCPPTGMTGLYLAWKDIVRKTSQGVFVNMAFNRDSPEARVVSFLPSQGRLTVIPKQSGRFYLRVPGFAPKDKVLAWRNGKKTNGIVWTGDYVTFTSARKGEELTVTYPLVQFDQKLVRAGREYTFHWKGNAVTGIEPANGVWPLFQKIPAPTPSFPNKAVPNQPSLVIEHCTLFDAESGQMLPDRTVVVKGERIVAVTQAGLSPKIPPHTVRIDGHGKFLLPGFIDAHVHLVHVLDFAHVTGDEVLPLYLAAGVTSVRSTGDELVAATLVARFAASHPDESPRVFTCSPLLDADPPIHRDVGRAVTDITQLPALFDDLEKWHISTVKIYAGTGREIGKAIIDEAHRRGLFVTAHLGNYAAQQAVDDGIDCLEHIWSVFNYSIPPEVANQPGHRGNLNLGNPICEELVAKLVHHKTYVDPTLVVFRNMILLPDVPDVHNSPDNALVPRRLRDFWPEYLKRTGCPQGGTLEARRREFAKYQELTGKLFRAGVPLLVGTDSPEPQVTPGYSLHQELSLLVESGLPPATVLQAVTLRNATALRQDKLLGSIAVGKLADMLLLTANPLKDIQNTRSIQLVFRGGKVCYPSQLWKMVPAE